MVSCGWWVAELSAADGGFQFKQGGAGKLERSGVKDGPDKGSMVFPAKKAMHIHIDSKIHFSHLPVRFKSALDL